MIYAGIDAGSRAIKIALLDSGPVLQTRGLYSICRARPCVDAERGHGPHASLKAAMQGTARPDPAFSEEKLKIIASGLCDQEVQQAKAADALYAKLLKDHGLKKKDIAGVVATGYGRSAIKCADAVVTEITCHAKGVRYFVKDAATVVDIGGQDSKVIKIDKSGSVFDFNMNDRCAAGTGRFLEVVAQRLGIKLGEYGKLAAKSRKPAQISSMCVVFAETEIISLLASGKKPADIASGIQHAIASRVTAMTGGRVELPIVFSGGVALVSGMKTALEKSLGHRIHICEMAQYTGAVGAALAAAERQ